MLIKRGWKFPMHHLPCSLSPAVQHQCGYCVHMQMRQRKSNGLEMAAGLQKSLTPWCQNREASVRQGNTQTGTCLGKCSTLNLAKGSWIMLRKYDYECMNVYKCIHLNRIIVINMNIIYIINIKILTYCNL